MIEEQILGRVAEGTLITHLDLGKPGRSPADSGEGGWAELSVPAVLLGELEHFRSQDLGFAWREWGQTLRWTEH